MQESVSANAMERAMSWECGGYQRLVPKHAFKAICQIAESVHTCAQLLRWRVLHSTGADAPLQGQEVHVWPQFKAEEFLTALGFPQEVIAAFTTLVFQPATAWLAKQTAAYDTQTGSAVRDLLQASLGHCDSLQHIAENSKDMHETGCMYEGPV